MIKTLDQEKFDTVKELAEMQVAISEGRAELDKVKKEKDEYLKLREEEGNERVAKVLKESHEALEQTTKNHDELTHYKYELQAFATTLMSFSTQIVTLFQGFKKWSADETKSLDEKSKQIATDMQEMKILSVKITEDRKQLARESARVADELRLLADRRGLLERGFAELKRKQQKI